MPSTVVVGGFFGDEGKGKIISYLAQKDDPEIVVRGGAGPNAGHTIEEGNKKHKVRMLPSGFLNKKAKLMIGPGVVVNPDVLHKEIKEFDVAKRTFVDYNCGIIEKTHTDADSVGRLKEKLGTTGSGTGPANADRAMRTLKLAKEIDSLKPYLTDVSEQINQTLEGDKGVLVEGTQGTFLSLWHGTYPFVTSKDVTASGICADIGLGPKNVDDVMVVFKSYVTRVGEGFLENELPAQEVATRGWSEVGTVTGRQRRAAEFNFNMAKRAVMLNSATQIALTKLDVMFAECAHKKSFDELSDRAKSFITKIEDAVDVPVTLIGTGAGVDDIIDLR
jgi:adenylosuccinate synthase